MNAIGRVGRVGSGVVWLVLERLDCGVKLVGVG